MKIGLITTQDPNNPRTWSGTNYFISRSLSKHVGSVVPIGPVEPSSLWVKRAENRLRKILKAHNIVPGQSYRVARDNAKIIEQRLKRENLDVLVAPAGSALIAFLESTLPIIYTSDATAELMIDYYPQFLNLSAKSKNEVNELEASSISRADAIIYPSRWAANSALQQYGADERKVHIVPFGANLMIEPEREPVLSAKSKNGLHLLFVGVDWQRKGGEKAIAILNTLVKRGFDAHLTIIGCVPPGHFDPERVTVYPFLDKTERNQERMLSELYRQSHFMILPTVNECFGIVFCEAAAHGVISLASNTGGVSSAVRDGVSGFLFSEDADVKQYADRICNLASNSESMRKLQETARDEFEENLNWDAWGERVDKIATSLL
ncbi:glycosyltransferase family 4 protein [Rhodosalinus sp. K401]|uniref:glycosyltransferase family 4 protein n=1 Tax=Rhodosalinus sp. K401 TaxID=3239195 RepID=UPI003524E9B1